MAELDADVVMVNNGGDGDTSTVASVAPKAGGRKGGPKRKGRDEKWAREMAEKRATKKAKNAQVGSGVGAEAVADVGVSTEAEPLKAMPVSVTAGRAPTRRSSRVSRGAATSDAL